MKSTELPTDHGLSMASEDYLESIYRLACDGDSAVEQGVRSVDVAQQLGVSKASVSKALCTLKEAGMVEQMRYGRVVLTPKGEAYAKSVWRSHRIIRAFLIEELGVEQNTADNEACLIEHYLSQDTMDRWCDYLVRQGLSVEE